MYIFYIGDNLRYFTAPNASNCLINQIITTESVCKHAISQLEGLNYRFAVRKLDRPSGCFASNGRQGFFNKVTDPSATTISRNDTFGICKEKHSENMGTF